MRWQTGGTGSSRALVGGFSKWFDRGIVCGLGRPDWLRAACSGARFWGPQRARQLFFQFVEHTIDEAWRVWGAEAA